MNLITRWILHEGKDREKQNMIWNMAGSFCYALASMVLAFLVMRIIGPDEGGIFSFAFSTFGQQMFLVAYFGIRPFQITDGVGQYSFGDYRRQRIWTCGLAVVLAMAYLLLGTGSTYSFEKIQVVFLMVIYKVIDGWADVYESEFQRNGRLYLTGKSNFFRTLLSVGCFLAALVATHNLVPACLIAVGAQAVGVLVFDIMTMHRLDAIDWRSEAGQIRTLFQNTVLLFISVFLDFYIFSASKYAIDRYLTDADSGYFNMIFMPTSVINLVAGFVIRPFLTRMTKQWNDRDFSALKSQIVRLGGMIAGLSVLAVGGTVILGKPVLQLLEMLLGSAYSGKLTGHHLAFVLIVSGGSCYAFLNLMYYVLVIMRKQKAIFVVYTLVGIVAWFLCPVMVQAAGIPGAAVAYLMLMILLAVGFGGLVWIAYCRSVDSSE